MKKRTNAYVSSGGNEYKKRLGSKPPLLPLATTVRIVHTWHAKPSGYTAKLKKKYTLTHARQSTLPAVCSLSWVLRRRVYSICMCCMCVYVCVLCSICNVTGRVKN